MSDWAKAYPWTAKFAVWSTLLLVWVVTVKTFFDPVDIPSGTASALATVFGLPAVTIGLYKARLKIEERRNVKRDTD